MTGSGKTGLLTVMAEEALRSQIPGLIIDIKGDLPNLLLSFPKAESTELIPWLRSSDTEDRSVEQLAQQTAAQRARLLGKWKLSPKDIQDFIDSTDIRVITPGSCAGEALHVLSSLERPSERWKTDPQSARDALSAAVSLVLRLLGRDADPVKSKEHVLLSVLAEARLMKGEGADLKAILEDIISPPIDHIGAMDLDSYFPKSERKQLACALNNLLGEPVMSSWREGASVDIAEWFTPKNGRTPAVILSVAHLDDEERALVLGVVLEELLTWVRGLSGSSTLKALVVFDELYGFMPPHPANPPTKRPLVALMKQARAFGVGMLVATQNPMDLDYRALGNAGVWCIGRLQTDADCKRVLDGLASSEAGTTEELHGIIKQLLPRWFVLRDMHSKVGTVLFQPRYTMSLLTGPMTESEVRKALAMSREWRKKAHSDEFGEASKENGSNKT
jgi:hypothetical protein